VREVSAYQEARPVSATASTLSVANERATIVAMAIGLAGKVISPILLDVRAVAEKVGANGQEFAHTATEWGNVATIPWERFKTNIDSFISEIRQSQRIFQISTSYRRVYMTE
jgi:hypothetical protein